MLCIESADAFLEEKEHPDFDCMLLDMRMPGTDGLELFRILNRKHLPYPVIFITGHGDIPLAVSAIKQGAYDFLTKPFQEGELLEKVKSAIDITSNTRGTAARTSGSAGPGRFLHSPGAGCHAFAGKRAAEQGDSGDAGHQSQDGRNPPRTCMEKMTADSLPALVRMITTLESGKTLSWLDPGHLKHT